MAFPPCGGCLQLSYKHLSSQLSSLWFCSPLTQTERAFRGSGNLWRCLELISCLRCDWWAFKAELFDNIIVFWDIYFWFSSSISHNRQNYKKLFHSMCTDCIEQGSVTPVLKCKCPAASGCCSVPLHLNQRSELLLWYVKKVWQRPGQNHFFGSSALHYWCIQKLQDRSNRGLKWQSSGIYESCFLKLETEI